MSSKAYKICNWHLLPSFHYFLTSNTKNKKNSNNKMALVCVGEVTSRIQGHQVYNYKCKVGEILICEREPINKHSQNAITVKGKDQQVIIHVPEGLTSKLFTIMQKWKIYKVNATISGEKRKVPEGTWVFGGGIQISCKYFLYLPAIHKISLHIFMKRLCVMSYEDKE